MNNNSFMQCDQQLNNHFCIENVKIKILNKYSLIFTKTLGNALPRLVGYKVWNYKASECFSRLQR